MSSDFYPSQLSTRPHDAKKFENAKNIVHLGLFYEYSDRPESLMIYFDVIVFRKVPFSKFFRAHSKGN